MLKKTEGIHIHPAFYSVSMSGLSFSAAFIVAIVGRLTGRKIKQSVSITGAVDLRGRVLDVSGIPQKVEAARRHAAVSKVLVPVGNREEWDNTKDSVHPSLRQYGDTALQPIGHIMEALEIMLEGE